MNFNNAYIITAISPKWTTAQKHKRLTVHREQVELLQKQGFNVFVFAQYNDHKIDGVTYLPWDGRKYLPGDARNECLRHFYQSECDFAVFLDDDTIVEEKYGFAGNFKEMIEQSALLDTTVSIISAVIPAFDSYSKFINDHSAEIRDVLILKNRPHQSGQFLIVRNIKKHFDKEIFFRENWCHDDGSVKYGEDCMFSMDFMLAGFGSYKCWNFVIQDKGKTNSHHSYGVTPQEVITERYRSIAREIASMYNVRVSNPGTDKQRVFWSEWGLANGNVKELRIPLL